MQGESRGSIEVVVRESTQHIEVSVSKLKGYEKHIIVELIKETHGKLSDRAPQAPNCRGNYFFLAEPEPFLFTSQTRIFSYMSLKDMMVSVAVILYEADKLSTDALLYIRWLLEKYRNTKVIFCCTDIFKLQPIRMLCSVLKLLPPSRDEV